MPAAPSVRSASATVDVQVDRLAVQQHLARDRAPDVEQVVDDPRQMQRLSRDHVLRELPLRVARSRVLQQVHRVRDRRERIAQLVAEHREKLVLRPARLRRFGERGLDFRGARAARASINDSSRVATSTNNVIVVTEPASQPLFTSVAPLTATAGNCAATIPA